MVCALSHSLVYISSGYLLFVSCYDWEYVTYIIEAGSWCWNHTATTWMKGETQPVTVKHVNRMYNLTDVNPFGHGGPSFGRINRDVYLANECF